MLTKTKGPRSHNQSHPTVVLAESSETQLNNENAAGTMKEENLETRVWCHTLMKIYDETQAGRTNQAVQKKRMEPFKRAI